MQPSATQVTKLVYVFRFEQLRLLRQLQLLRQGHPENSSYSSSSVLN